LNFSKRKIFTWLKILIILYCVLGIALFYLQEKFLFHPEKLPADHQFNFHSRFTEMQLPMNSSDTISLIRFQVSDTTNKGVVIYFHGNRQNVERYAPFAEIFTKLGYEVWMPDYPGFGKSKGSRAEKDLYSQAYQVYKLASSKFDPSQIIIYGKSFGTGIASYLASEVQSKMLILETPYNSIPGLFSYYAPLYPTKSMSKYQLPTEKFLGFITEPVIIFHGDDDGVIPLRNAEKLIPELKKGDQFNIIENAEHNNVASFDIYRNKIDSLLR